MYRLKYVIVVTFWWIFATGNIVRNEDICGSHNGRRLYLELGEKGILYAKNISFIRNLPRQLVPHLYSSTINNSSHHQCSLELVTCPSCVIVVTFKNIALSHHCGDGGIVMDNPCRCDYVWLSEPPYEDVSGSPFCGSYTPITYRSSTRTLSINLFYSQSHKHAFTIEYTAERNRLHLKGTEMTSGVPTKDLNGTTGSGILTSPFFPARYPRDLGLEYVITCPTEAPSCRIRLLFSDFQLATVSIMEFYDWNGQRLDVSSGARFRPPIIVSSGPSLLVRFYANGGTGLGYKAFYSFVIGHTYDKSIQPITNCGGYVENLGGAITMMNMVGQGVKIYDCVWLIRPPKNFLHMKTHMYLKVVAFADMAGNTELIIKEGPTSALMLSLEVIRHPSNQLQSLRHQEHIAPVTSGFHVSLRGTFGPNSHLAIAYAAFSYTDCFADTDFLCQNHRCIPNQLNCDSFDHCGDNSDEPATCFQNWKMEPRERKWHMNKANYYFPKIEQYPDLKTATLVFVASSLGLIVLITTLIILLYRIGGARQRELQSRLETISELLDGAQIDEISIPDDPPGYEAPPGYEEITVSKKSRCLNCESYNRSSSNQFDEDANSSTYLVMESANNSCSSQTIPVASGNDRHTLPESPPPPYITPPGTILRNMNLFGLSASMKQMCPVRRNWLRRSAQYPQSSFRDRPSSSMDAEVLDTYLTDCTVPNTNWRLESPPKDIQIVSDTVQENTVEVLKANCQHVTDETIDRSDERNTSCSCEGACGCVISSSSVQDHSASNLSTSATPISDECELERDKMVIASSSVGKIDEHQEEDFSVSKSTIVRLLGSRLVKPSCHSANSTAASSPSGTLHHSCRMFSRDNCITKISTMSTCSSYDKLQDDFEIVSETASTTNSNTPNDTPKSVVNQHGRRNSRPKHISCDLDSLYEGIKILDSYLARRNINIGHSHRQSVAVMLFGTPEHGSAHNPVALSRQTTREKYVRARIWRSSEDAASN
ncbi:Cubilin [Camponotus floridanus]|uniref:Cubilin n=1 Tax=Camponotus floridanus TaxID=104421 RepID=E2ACT9_CAMFO|nr:Cubilin [Camponotus floridanus]